MDCIGLNPSPTTEALWTWIYFSIYKMLLTFLVVPKYSSFQNTLQIMTHLGLVLIAIEGIHIPVKAFPYIYSEWAVTDMLSIKG